MRLLRGAACGTCALMLARAILCIDTVGGISAASPAHDAGQVGTERVLLHSIGMRHREGGWPKDVDIDDQDAKNRFRKKAEKVQACGYRALRGPTR